MGWYPAKCRRERQRPTQLVPGLPRGAPGTLCGLGHTFLEESPGTEERVLQWQPGQVGVLLEAGVQPPHQWVDCGMAEAEGSRGEHVGHGGVHGGIVALVGTHVLPDSLGAQDSGDVIPQRDDLRERRAREPLSREPSLCPAQARRGGPHTSLVPKLPRPGGARLQVRGGER